MTHKQTKGFIIFPLDFATQLKNGQKSLLAQTQVLFTKLTVSYLQLTNFFCSGFNT